MTYLISVSSMYNYFNFYGVTYQLRSNSIDLKMFPPEFNVNKIKSKAIRCKAVSSKTLKNLASFFSVFDETGPAGPGSFKSALVD